MKKHVLTWSIPLLGILFLMSGLIPGGYAAALHQEAIYPGGSLQGGESAEQAAAPPPPLPERGRLRRPGCGVGKVPLVPRLSRRRVRFTTTQPWGSTAYQMPRSPPAPRR